MGVEMMALPWRSMYCLLKRVWMIEALVATVPRPSVLVSMLFSSRLAFPHPVTGKILAFSVLPGMTPFDLFSIPDPGEKGFFDD